MKYLVTGASGFIGTNVVLALLERGADVVGVDSLSRRGSESNLQRIQSEYPHYKFYKCEIEDIPSVIFREEPGLVFHFAAQVAVTSSVESPLRDFRINAEGTFLVARSAHDLGVPVIYTSTNKVYGNNVNFLAITEHETRYDFGGEYAGKGVPETLSIDANHHTPYGVSKLVGELYVREFGGIANRCSCMYGPNQFGIVDQGWLSHIATNKLSGRDTVIYGDGKQVRDALHVSDVVRLLLSEADAMSGEQRASLAGEVFNVGGGIDKTISLLELCERWEIKPSFAEWRPADQKVFYCDVSKAKDTFNWAPEVGLDEGLEELFAWTKTSLDAR